MMCQIRMAFERWYATAYTGTELFYGKTGYVDVNTAMAFAAFKAGRAFIPRARVTNA